MNSSQKSTNHITSNRVVRGSVTALTICAALGLSAAAVSAASLTWNGTSTSTAWTNGVVTDWLSSGNSVAFSNGDDVLFSDSATSFAPAVGGVVQPNSITVNAVAAYTFGGSGSISGTTSLTKTNTGTLTINTNNAFTGGVFIQQGTVVINATNALGTTSNLVMINGGTLDFHSTHSPANFFYFIQGTGFNNTGALNNSGTSALQNGAGIASITLTGDATIGVSGARLDMWGLDDVGSTGLTGNGFALSKVGAQPLWLNDGGTNTALGNINIVAGLLGVQSEPGFPGTSLGDPTKTLTIYPGATFATYRTPATLLMNKNIVMTNASFENSIGVATFPGTWTLYGTNNQIAGFSESASDQVIFNGVVSGPGALIKGEIGTDVFNAPNTYSGATIINAGKLVLNSTISNTSLILINSNSVVDATGALYGLTLGVGQTLASGAAAGTVLGNVTNTAGSTIAAGNGGPGLLTVNQLTLSGATNMAALGSNPSDTSGSVSSFLQVNGDLDLVGTNSLLIVPLGALNTSSPYTIAQYSGSLVGNPANLQISGVNPRYTYSLLNPTTTAPTIQVSVTGALQPLLWRGTDATTPGVWNAGSSNWFNTVTSAADRFYPEDIVVFDDSGVSNAVNVTQSVSPVSTTFTNNNLNYTLTGTGTVSGPLTLNGNGSVTYATSNIVAFSTISADLGTLVFKSQLASYSIGSTLLDDGNGLGTIVKGDAGTATLTGNNLGYSGTIIITNGLLRYTNYTGLGQPPSSLYITNTGSLDLNDVNAGLKSIVIAGSGFNGLGALYDSSANTAQHSIVANVTMVADATVGCAGRWDFPSSGAADAGGTLNGNGFKLTKVGAGQIWISPSGGIGIGDADVVAGTLGFSPHVTDLGDTTKTITVESNASMYLWGNPTMLVKNFVLNNKATVNSGSSGGGESFTNNMAGPVTLIGTNSFNAASASIALWSVVQGTGSFTKSGNSNMLLFGTNTYTGPTVVSAGTLFAETTGALGASSLIQISSGAKLDISVPAAITLGSGQTLDGSGTLVGGNLVVGNGATLAPGLPGTTTAALTASGSITLQSGSTNLAKIKRTTSIANDNVTGAASITYGGTLVISNITGSTALVSGDAIPLFHAATYGGTFANIIPATPGPGLGWNTNTLATDGTLRVIGTGPVTTPTNITFSVSGGQLTLTWPTDHTGWTLQTQTNAPGAGITTNWVDVTGSTGTNQEVFPITTNGSVFYRNVLK